MKKKLEITAAILFAILLALGVQYIVYGMVTLSTMELSKFSGIQIILEVMYLALASILATLKVIE